VKPIAATGGCAPVSRLGREAGAAEVVRFRLLARVAGSETVRRAVAVPVLR